MNPFKQATPDQYADIANQLRSQLIEQNGIYQPKYTEQQIEQLKTEAQTPDLTNLLSHASDLFIHNQAVKENVKGIISLPIVKNIINQLGKRTKLIC